MREPKTQILPEAPGQRRDSKRLLFLAQNREDRDSWWRALRLAISNAGCLPRHIAQTAAMMWHMALVPRRAQPAADHFLIPPYLLPSLSYDVLPGIIAGFAATLGVDSADSTVAAVQGKTFPKSLSMTIPSPKSVSICKSPCVFYINKNVCSI